MCLGSCRFNIWVRVLIRSAMPQRGHCWWTPLVYKCHPSAGYLFEWGATALRNSKASDRQDCSACVEIYGDVADVFSGTKINRVIYGDWFGFWKLISDGWSFLFLYSLWKRSWAITYQWWNHLAKPATFSCAKQAIQIPAFVKMGATCFSLFSLMLTKCSDKLRHGSLTQQLSAHSIQFLKWELIDSLASDMGDGEN